MPDEADTAPSLSPAVWIPALIVVVGALLAIFGVLA
jgi:hypothetical protein